MSPLPSRLPSVPPVAAGDSFLALVQRSAALYGITAPQAAELLGHSLSSALVGLDATRLDGMTRTRIAARTGLAPDAVERMFLPSVASPYLASTTQRPRTWWISRGSEHQQCRRCLADDPHALLLLWRVTLLPACPIHRSLLAWQPDQPQDPVEDALLQAQQWLTDALERGGEDTAAACAAQTVAGLVELAASADAAMLCTRASGRVDHRPAPGLVARYLPSAVHAVSAGLANVDTSVYWRQVVQQALDIAGPRLIARLSVIGALSAVGLFARLTTYRPALVAGDVPWLVVLREASLPIVSFVRFGADLLYDAYAAIAGDAPTFDLALRLAAIDTYRYRHGDHDFLWRERPGWGLGLLSTLAAVHEELEQQGRLDRWEAALDAMASHGSGAKNGQLSGMEDAVERFIDDVSVRLRGANLPGPGRAAVVYWYVVHYLGRPEEFLRWGSTDLHRIRSGLARHKIAPAVREHMLAAAAAGTDHVRVA